ncbi:hypothetical protein NDI56_06575 [Haloarcula sp. S1CR25-12]|uniref:Lipoprotein n=1 Tax=Haloarcula saliterrae TaxID=2950534 RepID=A0ABU2F9X8_9EURY|nr:hypothetical protein [Haloarcula sp. S1CR25-12]MDS0259054.1 hypothetical protein [Haloarcula sp. S1CR25-12]
MQPPFTHRSLVVLLALLALGAGCQAPPSGPTTETEPGTPANGASVPQSFLDSHEPTVRVAGSATVNRTTLITRPVANGTESETLTQTTLLRVAFERGRAFERLDPLGGDGIVRYRTENGTTYERYAGGELYYGPQRSQPINESEALTPMLVADSALERRGPGTVDGVSGTVYVVTSFSALGEGVYDSVDPETVTAFNATYVVDERGYVAYQRLRFTVERESGTLTVTESVRTSEVGSTSVEPPAWLDEARAQAAARE